MARLTLKTAEIAGFALAGALAVAALLTPRFHGPPWLTDCAVGVGLLIAIPTAVLNIRRRWRGE